MRNSLPKFPMTLVILFEAFRIVKVRLLSFEGATWLDEKHFPWICLDTLLYTVSTNVLCDVCCKFRTLFELNL